MGGKVRQNSTAYRCFESGEKLKRHRRLDSFIVHKKFQAGVKRWHQEGLADSWVVTSQISAPRKKLWVPTYSIDVP